MISVILYDEHPLSLDGLEIFLKNDQSMQIIGKVDDLTQFEQAMQQNSADIAIIGLPFIDQSTIFKQFKKYKSSKFIILYVDFNAQFFRKALNYGFSGLVSKRNCKNEIFEAIHSVKNGETFLSQEITNNFKQVFIRKKHNNKFSEDLTKKEKEVLSLVLKGLTTKLVAVQLNISFNTAQTHRRNIMNKLNLHNVTELISYCAMHNLD